MMSGLHPQVMGGHVRMRVTTFAVRNRLEGLISGVCQAYALICMHRQSPLQT